MSFNPASNVKHCLNCSRRGLNCQGGFPCTQCKESNEPHSCIYLHSDDVSNQFLGLPGSFKRSQSDPTLYSTPEKQQCPIPVKHVKCLLENFRRWRDSMRDLSLEHSPVVMSFVWVCHYLSWAINLYAETLQKEPRQQHIDMTTVLGRNPILTPAATPFVTPMGSPNISPNASEPSSPRLSRASSRGSLYEDELTSDLTNATRLCSQLAVEVNDCICSMPNVVYSYIARVDSLSQRDLRISLTPSEYETYAKTDAGVFIMTLLPRPFHPDYAPWVNERFARMLGYDTAEQLIELLSDQVLFLHLLDTASLDVFFTSLLRAVRKRKDAFSSQMLLRHKEGYKQTFKGSHWIRYHSEWGVPTRYIMIMQPLPGANHRRANSRGLYRRSSEPVLTKANGSPMNQHHFEGAQFIGDLNEYKAPPLEQPLLSLLEPNEHNHGDWNDVSKSQDQTMMEYQSEIDNPKTLFLADDFNPYGDTDNYPVLRINSIDQHLLLNHTRTQSTEMAMMDQEIYQDSNMSDMTLDDNLGSGNDILLS